MKQNAIFISLTLTCAILLAASAFTGSAPLPAGDILAALLGRGDEAAQLIVQEIRLPRAVAALGAGAALGLSGAALQGLLQNPLAEPGVLGVSASASLGAVIAIYFGWSAPGGLVMMVAAIAAALLAVALLALAAGPRTGTLQLILTGLGISSFCGALVSLAFNLSPNPYSLSDLLNWLMGSVTNRSWTDIRFVLPVWLAGAGLVFLAGRGLRALTFGGETAASLGANPLRTRWLVVSGTALLTGASVAIAGVIGFAGIVAPHLMRPFVRHDPQALLPASALAGGAILLMADLLIRLVAFDPELKLGVAAALFGAPVFLWVALRAGSVSR